MSSSSNVAVITGASSGIGKELAVYHAKQGGDCILVARRKEALDKLKTELEKEYNIKCYVITSDLSKAGAAEKLYKDIKELKVDVNILINNAGFGGHGTVIDREVVDDVNMIMVNVVSATVLAKLIAKDMASKKIKGKILNVGSTAGFMPGPYQAVYFATKAYLNSFSQAMDEELRSEYGITSTVLCPGKVNTEFVAVAKLEGTPMVEQQPGATAESVAKLGYNKMLQGQLVTINEYGLWFVLNYLVPMMPRRLVLKMGSYMQKK